MYTTIDNQRKVALQFVVILGIVSLFGDITYEGARSITGPYLAVLGASATIVGLVSGLGEFVGYALRLLSGYFADRSKRYWFITIIGYALLVSIPLLAFARYWQLAAMLIILERLGKAIRTPARDAILSHATKQVGRGWGFGIHEALDQLGAVIGPLVFSAMFIFKGGYREGFTILWIPAILTLATLLLARSKVPSLEKLEASCEPLGRNIKIRGFWVYTLFTFLSVSGFANFQLISYHLKTQSVVSDLQIPVLYAIAMGVDASVALIIGKTYDKIGMRSLVTIPLLTIPIPLFAFSHNYNLVVISVLFWGAVMGCQETIMRAAIADLIPVERRGFAYGMFNTVYGAGWFFGSAVMGLMYDFYLTYLTLFVVMMEMASVLVLLLLRRKLSL